jgi:phosphoribosylaminoimidazolecarboxamide formyltransferase / IMP cyclohydrolase
MTLTAHQREAQTGPGAVRVARALLSVSDKTDLVPFARALVEMGVALISTGGTARALEAAGVPVTPVEQVTRFPEMMDGRVKTLHPAIHGGLLALRDHDDHMQAMHAHGIEPIDLVCINLYPFEQTIRREGVSWDEAIEQIDIGGPSMIRSAAKNHRFVAVVTSAAQYDLVVSQMRAHGGAVTDELRRELAAAAFSRTAEYDAAISAWMHQGAETPFPHVLRTTHVFRQSLRYGENPHQTAALYADPAAGGASVVGAAMLHGKPLSYNNLLDAAATLELVHDLHDVFDRRPAAAIVKHTNACGAAIGSSAAEAFRKAYEGDALAAYGGIYATNVVIDLEAADAIAQGDRFLEVIVAPGFHPEAAARLADRWKNVRLLDVGPFRRSAIEPPTLRSIPGGMLVQGRDTVLAKPQEWTVAAGPAPAPSLREDAVFAWTLVKHLKSNAVCIAANQQLLGAGAGQMDRVTASRLAIEKAGPRIAGAPAVAASDAFFPFADGPKLLIDAGVKCLVHPGGSKRDEDTFQLCRDRGVTCLLTGVRHFRH